MLIMHFLLIRVHVRRVETETELLGVENLIRRIFESLRARNVFLRPALSFEVVAAVENG